MYVLYCVNFGRRMSAASGLLGLRIRILLGAWMSVYWECSYVVR